MTFDIPLDEASIGTPRLRGTAPCIITCIKLATSFLLFLLAGVLAGLLPLPFLFLLARLLDEGALGGPRWAAADCKILIHFLPTRASSGSFSVGTWGQRHAVGYLAGALVDTTAWLSCRRWPSEPVLQT